MNKPYIENSFLVLVAVVILVSGLLMFSENTLAVLNRDALLSNLTISVGTLNPGFVPDTTSYAVSVDNSVSSVTVIPTANEFNEIITVNGAAVASGSPSDPISLNEGPNTISVVVSSQAVALEKLMANYNQTGCNQEDNSWCGGSDINRDGSVDASDLAVFLANYSDGILKTLTANYNQSACYEENSWCSGSDINRDGKVDSSDLAIYLANLETLKANYNQTGCDESNSWCSGSDINRDGSVDSSDLAIFLVDFETLNANYNQSACNEANSWCSGSDLNQDGKVDSSDLAIYLANFKLTNTYTVIVTRIAIPVPIPTVNPMSTSGAGGGMQTTAKLGDANGDDKVDGSDFDILMSQWGQTGSGLSGDLNHDSVVNGLDFSLLMANWSK